MTTLMNKNANGTAPVQRGENRVSSPFPGLFGWDPLRLLSTSFDTGISRTENGYELEIPVPGFGPQQVELSYHEGVLQVEGKSEKRQIRQSVLLPDDADPEKIQARVENGLLTVRVERYEHTKPRKITVQSNNS